MALIEKLQEIKTKIESGAGGGSGEDLVIENCDYLFYINNRIELLPQLHSKLKPTTAKYMFATNANSTYNTSKDILSYINKIDFTKTTSMTYFLSTSKYSNLPEELIFNIPVCIDLSRFFNGVATSIKKVVFKNSNKVANWGYCFYTGYNNAVESNQKKIEEIELDMSACTNCTWFFNNTTNAYSNCPYLKKITFTGSFGGNSTSSTLTLDLSKLEAMTKDSFVDMFTSLGENTNGKTRIIQISAAIYNAMSEDELAIATSKGYTITSA